jgi:hypothetical protein
VRKTLLVILAALALTGCGGESGTDPADLAARIGASKCEQTNYTIESNLTGDKTIIYSCYRDYQNICVTEENDIARDETATVTALFADAFVADKPVCAD